MSGNFLLTQLLPSQIVVLILLFDHYHHEHTLVSTSTSMQVSSTHVGASSFARINGRERIIRYKWKRQEGAPMLPNPPPRGKRTPNNIVWASHPDRFYQIEYVPNLPMITFWSLSMIADWNENHYREVASDEIEPEADPQLVLPFPWLRLPIEIPRPPSNAVTQTFWQSIQGENRVGGLLPKLDGFDPQKPIKFGSVYKPEYKLEEFIPAVYFPDILIINDPKGITEGKQVSEVASKKLEAAPRKYRRVWPIMDPTALTEYPDKATGTSSEDLQKVAYLNLAGAPLLGRGHHSAVHRGALKLPGELEAYTADGSIGVAAKIAFPLRGARRHLEREGETYNQIYGKATNVSLKCIDKEGKAIPANYKGEDGRIKRHLMEHWSGFCMASTDQDMYYPVPVKAVVPKFFGYYVPTEEAEEAAKERRAKAKGKGDRTGKERSWKSQQYDKYEDNMPAETILSPILLIEDCGTPIDPSTMSIDNRTECLSFLDRLDLEKIHHHSFYARNILVQPGPLDVGPPLRSMKTPSYRLIDLGRTQHWDLLAKLEQERRNLPDERDDTQDHKTKMEWRNIKHQWDLDNEASRKLGRVELRLPPL